MFIHELLAVPIHRLFVLLIVPLAFISAAAVTGQTPASQASIEITLKECGPNTKPLPELNQRETRKIAPGEVQCYRFTLAKQYIHIEVNQQGVDLLSQLFTSGGGEKIGPAIDTLSGRDGIEPISAVSEAPVEYVLAVKSQDDASAVEPNYTLRVTELRAAKDTDAAYVHAEQSMLQGRLNLASRDFESAVRFLEDARTSLQPFPDPKPEIWATILNDLGFGYRQLQQTDKALSIFLELRDYTDRFPNPNDRTLALIALNSIYIDKGDLDSAEMSGRQATEVAGNVSDELRGEAWDSLGRTYLRRNRPAEGVAALEQAANFFTGANKFDKLADTYTAIAITFFNRSVLKTAQLYYEKALNAGASTPGPVGYASYNLGVTLDEMGQYDAALKAFLRAQDFYEAVRKSGGEEEYQAARPHVLKGLGFANSSLGHDVEAQAIFREALGLVEKDGRVLDPNAAAYLHLYMGFAASRLGQRQVADDETKKALRLFEQLGNDRGRGNAFANIGYGYYLEGDLDHAISLLGRAAALQTEDLFGLAYTKTNLARVLIDQGQSKEALQLLKEALDLRETVGDKAGEAMTLYTLALAELRGADLQRSFEHIDKARGIVENIRQNSAAIETRAAYRATVDKIYKLYVDVLVRRGQVNEALEFEDNMRARSLSETLANADVNLFLATDPANSQKRQSLNDEIVRLAGKRQLLGPTSQTSAPAVELNREIDKRAAQLRLLDEQALRDSRVAALVSPPKLSLAEIKAQLDPNSVLLEYSLGEERSYLFVVSARPDDEVKVVPLPKRTELENLSKPVRELLLNPAMDRKTRTEYERISRQLSAKLLSEITGEIDGKRLIIVADGILHYIPFSALPELKASTWQPLFLQHEIVKIPSLSALAAIRSRGVNRSRATEVLVFVGGPVYNAPTGAPLKVTDAQKEERPLRTLIYSKDELANIETAYRKLKVSKPLKSFTGYDATRKNALSAALTDFRIVHYSVHGAADDTRPHGSGIYLTRYDATGREIPYFVSLADLYNLRLSSDLVVLSACESALGKNVSGEGIVGLTRGFLHAGSASVLSSLWEVNEFHTAKLVGVFYENLFAGKQTPAAALGKAQESMWKTFPPYYWAAFELHGDWRLSQPF